MNYPFKQKTIAKNILLREFNSDTHQDELIWHRDKNDRIVEVVSGSGWKFQRDNSLPVLLQEGDRFKIPAEQYHRLLRGKTNLLVKIYEQKDEKALKSEAEVDEDAFTYKIAKAALDGKDKVKIGDEEHPVKMSKEKAKEIVGESTKTHDPHYSAPRNSKRAKQIDATKADLASGDPKRVQRAYDRRARMEKQAADNPKFKNNPRKDTKKESVLRNYIREMLREEVIEEKKKSSAGKLSDTTKATLKKKAEKRGLTPGSVYAEYRKGLAAWATSGSRKGMSQHQWAHARVNAATPSKPWAVVKKSKAKKK
tara:strand:- start:513 stop:1442 length:930 start_codon:yes stop_codon:yes gene_type:complete